MLDPGEEVVYVALGARGTAGFREYLPGTLIFFVIALPVLFLFGDNDAAFWIGVVVAGVLSFAVDLVVRRRRRTRMIALGLLTVTDRRLLRVQREGSVEELPLAAIERVELASAGVGTTLLRIGTRAGEDEIPIASDWPKKSANKAASEIASYLRRSSPSAS